MTCTGALAQQCFESARSHEPTLVCVWEAMANLSSTASQVNREGAGAHNTGHGSLALALIQARAIQCTLLKVSWFRYVLLEPS